MHNGYKKKNDASGKYPPSLVIYRSNMNQLNYFIVILLVTIFSISVLSEPLIYTELRFENGTAVDMLRFDRVNSSVSSFHYGSNSYMDSSYTTANLILRLCHPLLQLDQTVDLLYTSESGNLSVSVLEPYLPTLTSISANTNETGTSYCTDADVMLASTRAMYPGYITARLHNTSGNITNFEKITQAMNGSFKLGVSVTPFPKVYELFVREIYDDVSARIITSGPQLVMSLVNKDMHSEKEAIVALYEAMSYGGSLIGGETVWVNGIMSLEIKLVNPCDTINESGYYLLNRSLLNSNGTCFVLNNISNVVLNFGDELIDGDNQENGSMREGICPVTIENSVNITIESLRTQQFYNGICIINSSVVLIGNNTVYDFNGMWITNSSTVYGINLYIGNSTGAEIAALNDSYVKLSNVTFATAQLSSEFYNVNVSSVSIMPPDPNVTGIDDISQFIEYTNVTVNSSWAQMSFFYSEPLPNGVSINNISIYDYNATYGDYFTYEENVTVGNLTNQTIVYNHTGWHDGEWKNISTLVDTVSKLIMSSNITSFSIFAPYGFVVYAPEPTPTPTPMPSGGGGGGGGSSPARPTDLESSTLKTAIRLKLELPESITVRQGQAMEIPFNLTNIGDISANNLTVYPSLYRGWESTNYTNETLPPGVKISSNFSIAPYEKATPKDYYILVSVEVLINNESFKVIQDVLHLIVIPRGNLSRLRVLEYPPAIEIWPRQELDVGFLVENIGDLPLNNVTIKYEPSICLINISGMNDILVGETKHIHYKFTAASEGICNYNIKFYSGAILVGFVPVKISIKKAVWIQQPVKTTILLFILIIWTMLTMIVLSRKRNRKKESQSEEEAIQNGMV